MTGNRHYLIALSLHYKTELGAGYSIACRCQIICMPVVDSARTQALYLLGCR